MRSLPNNSTTYNAWFYWYDGNSAILLQVWNNKVSLNSVEVTGLDNQTDFHTYRIVSDAYGASADQRFDLYRDGVLIINDAPNVVNTANGRQVVFGDMTGAEKSMWKSTTSADARTPGCRAGAGLYLILAPVRCC